MKLSIVTITCRENPRFEEVYRTLAGSLARCPTPLEVEWIIVDDKQRVVTSVPLADTIGVKFVAPLASTARTQLDKDPAHNSARNAGLLALAPDSDYVVFLNDCTIVTKGWFELVRDVAAQNLGLRCRAHVMHDIALPADGAVTYKDHNDRLREVPPATVAGACWGAPKAAFDAIGGFDLAYDGEDRGHDADAIVRLARTGLRFVCSERAFAITLKRTKNRGEVSTRKAAFVGARNTKYLNALAKDRRRIYPVVTHPDLATRAGIPAAAIAASSPAGSAHLIGHAAAPVKSGRVGPRGPKDPTALDDYIALCHDVEAMIGRVKNDRGEVATGWSETDYAAAQALWEEMRPNQKLIAGQKLGELVHDYVQPTGWPKRTVIAAKTVSVPPRARGLDLSSPDPDDELFVEKTVPDLDGPDEGPHQAASPARSSANGVGEAHADDDSPADTWLGD